MSNATCMLCQLDFPTPHTTVQWSRAIRAVQDMWRNCEHDKARIWCKTCSPCGYVDSSGGTHE